MALATLVSVHLVEDETLVVLASPMGVQQQVLLAVSLTREPASQRMPSN